MTTPKKISVKLMYMIIIILPLLLFYKAADFDFVWDDAPLYINQKNFPTENVFANFSKFWSPNMKDMYIPVTNTFWALAATFASNTENTGQISPKVFHLLNILFHILNSVFVFIIIRRLLKADFGAFLGALLFALHPIQVESVAWVSELRGLLAAFFGFLSIILYMNYLDNKNDAKTKGNSLKFYILTCVTILLSMLSKPSAIVFPFIIVVIDYVKTGRKPIEILKSTALLILLIIPFILIAKSTESKAFIDSSAPLWARPMIYLDSFAFYIYKLIIPINLASNYGLSPSYMMSQPWFFVAWIIPVALFVFLIIKKEFKAIAAVIIFLIGYLPVSGLINFYFQYFSSVADRYIYISMLGSALVLAYLISKINNQKTLNILGISIPLVLLILSYIQIPAWKNELTLWRDVVEKYPDRSAPSHSGYGMALLATKDYGRAIEELSKAIKLGKNHPDYFYNRGSAYIDLQSYPLALADFESTIKLNPKYSNAHFNKAIVLSEMGSLTEAIDAYSQALTLEPNQSDIYSNRGILYAKLNKIDSAVSDFQQAIKINPRDYDAKYNLDLILSQKQATGK